VSKDLTKTQLRAWLSYRLARAIHAPEHDSLMPALRLAESIRALPDQHQRLLRQLTEVLSEHPSAATGTKRLVAEFLAKTKTEEALKCTGERA
jgi:hypothetical protein